MKFIGILKWILLILGTARANIIGGFIGFIVGYTIEEYVKNNLSIEFEKPFKEKKIKYSTYQNRLLALISEVIKADGYIHKEEIYFVKNYLLVQFGSVYANMMLKTLKLQVDKKFNIRDISLNLAKNLSKEEKIKLLTFLHGISLQNGAISIKEKLIIKQISVFFGLTEVEYNNITNARKHERKTSNNKSRVYGYNPYEILGISSNSTEKEIKKAYRKMVLKYHPDRTDIDDSIANEKFSEISEAYNVIKKSRDIR